MQLEAEVAGLYALAATGNAQLPTWPGGGNESYDSPLPIGASGRQSPILYRPKQPITPPRTSSKTPENAKTPLLQRRGVPTRVWADEARE